MSTNTLTFYPYLLLFHQCELFTLLLLEKKYTFMSSFMKVEDDNPENSTYHKMIDTEQAKWHNLLEQPALTCKHKFHNLNSIICSS